MSKAASAFGNALVTGASAGIGGEFARQLAASGVNLTLVARRRDRLEALAAELREKYGVSVDIHTADLSKPAEIQALATKIAESKDIDLLVNNAGFGGKTSFSEDSPENSESMIQVHVVAPILLSRAAVPAMLARKRGAVINVSSLAAFSPLSGAMYSSTKALLTMFSVNLGQELRGTGVHVQALCPGFTHTEFHEAAAIDEKRIPGPFWTTARRVVRTSLAALAGNKVIVIPGFRNKVLGFVMRCPLTSWIIPVAGRLPAVKKRTGRASPSGSL